MDDSRGAPLPAPRVPPPQGPDPLIGRVINERYRIVGTIARGGMGKVYRAEQQPLGRLVALKVLDPNYVGESDPEFHRRFFLEASTASKLTHPNTVTIFDYGRTDDEIYYIAMELLEGRTLHRAIRDEGPFSADRTMNIGRQICRSLREAHAISVIHRDLKPANVYLVEHGDESELVKVLDFGLVKNVEDKGEDLTQTGLFMGSPKYMSPEQIRGEPVDARVDVYALGVMMYEMLTGKVPFDRANSVNILMAHIQEQVPPMSDFNPEVRVPPALEMVVRRCMAKHRDERYASMDAVLAALKQCAGFSGTTSIEYRLESGEHKLVYEGTPGGGTLQHGATPSRSFAGATLGAAAEQGPLAEPKPAPDSGKRAGPWIFASVLVAAVVALILRPSPEQEKVSVVATSLSADPSTQEPTGAAPVEQPVAVAEPGSPSTAQDGVGVGTVVSTVLVLLRSTPPGATVVVGDKEFGPTPTQVEWSGAEAEVGREVTFRFQRKGYRDLTVTRQIRGDRLEVEAPPMDPIPVRRPTRDDRPTTVTPVTPGKTVPLKDYKAEPY